MSESKKRSVCWYHPDLDTPEFREKIEFLGFEPQPNRHIPDKEMVYVVDLTEHFHRPYDMEQMLRDNGLESA